jgi:hypothetical protein
VSPETICRRHKAGAFPAHQSRTSGRADDQTSRYRHPRQRAMRGSSAVDVGLGECGHSRGPKYDQRQPNFRLSCPHRTGTALASRIRPFARHCARRRRAAACTGTGLLPSPQCSAAFNTKRMRARSLVAAARLNKTGASLPLSIVRPPLPCRLALLGMYAKVFGLRLCFLVDVVATVANECPRHAELDHGPP